MVHVGKKAEIKKKLSRWQGMIFFFMAIKENSLRFTHNDATGFFSWIAYFSVDYKGKSSWLHKINKTSHGRNSQLTREFLAKPKI